MAETAIRITGLDIAIKKYAKIESNINNTYSPLKVIAAKMWKEQMNHFESEMGPDEPWKRSRRAIRENGQTLVDTGRLRSSIRFGNDGKSAWVGTNVNYSEYCQNGTPRMKERPFIWMSEGFRDGLNEYLRQWVMAK